VTVNAKKTEFICMGCWGTFSPQGTTEGGVICPHCGARQELQHEPIDLDPEEFVDLGPELAGAPAPEAGAPETTATAGAAPSDDDFDAVIEIDLDEIDSNEEFADAGQYTEPIPAASEPGEQAPENAASEEEPVPLSHYHLRTERGHVYTFLSPEAVVQWARRLSQSPKLLQVSLDGADWSAYLPFVSRLVATGHLDDEEFRDLSADEEPITDDALAKDLDDEKHAFEAGAAGPQAAVVNAEAPPAPKIEATPARGVGDFTFKIVERVETPVLRYALMLGIGAVLGAGLVTTLALLGVLPSSPF